MDTEEENFAAIQFFYKHGFRQPIKHVYLDLNLTDMQKKYKEEHQKEHTHQKESYHHLHDKKWKFF